MKILNAGCPRADGFYMPAEYAPHNGTIIIWPKRPGSWIYGARRAREAFAEVICAIAESEQAYVLAEADVIDNARSVVEAVRVYSEPDTYFFISLFYFIPVKQILRYGIKYNMVTYFYQLIHLLR